MQSGFPTRLAGAVLLWTKRRDHRVDMSISSNGTQGQSTSVHFNERRQARSSTDRVQHQTIKSRESAVAPPQC